MIQKNAITVSVAILPVVVILLGILIVGLRLRLSVLLLKYICKSPDSPQSPAKRSQPER